MSNWNETVFGDVWTDIPQLYCEDYPDCPCTDEDHEWASADVCPAVQLDTE